MNAELVPVKWRKAIYVVYALVGVTLGAIREAYSTLDHAAPTWTKVAAAVYLFLGGAFGLVAASHTDTKTDEGADPVVPDVPEDAVIDDTDTSNDAPANG